MTMRKIASLAAALLAVGTALPTPAQVAPRSEVLLETRPAPQGPVDSTQFTTSYIRLGLRDAEGLLFEPRSKGPKSRIALVYAHPNGNSFTEPLGIQLASRGHYALMVNNHQKDEADDIYLPGISQAIRYLRSLPGVDRVVIVGHSGGGHLMAFYQNVAEHGPSACSGPEKIIPCRIALASGLEKPDGIVLIDPTLGAFHQASSLDPAQTAKGRNPALDMFAPANGYDAAAKRAHYSAGFIQRFHAAQAARNAKVVADALARLQLIEGGKGRYPDDEPFIVPGMGVNAAGTRLYQPDTALVAHTRGAFPLLKADGVSVTGVIQSVRPPTGQQMPQALGTLGQMTQNSTVRRFLASHAVRTLPGFAITADNITGVDWHSAFSSTPANAEGITVPALVLTMSCHYLVVPDEIIFEHLGSPDKTLQAVEGATHLFAPCKPEFGDTVKTTFDAVANWLDEKGRF